MSTKDIQSIAKLRPSDVQQHLIAMGWRQSQTRDDVLRFERAVNDSTVKLSLLLRADFEDYARRMSELIETLAHIEDRPPADLIEELSAPPGDTIAFRSVSDVIESGTIPILESLRIREAQRALLLAAAHSALEPQAHFPRMAKARALEFLADCREGQTARGSYVVKLIVPVIPAVGALPVEEPFGRVVVKKLVSAFSEVSQALKHGTLDVLLDRARQGVSANFLEALAGLHPPGERGAVEVAVRWSRTRPVPGTAPTFRFDAGYATPLSGVAFTLKETHPSPGYEVEGYVAALRCEGSDSDRPGTVVIATQLASEAGISTVRVELPPDDYARAMTAHANARPVRVIGTLVKKGRSWWLNRPGAFQEVPEPDELDA